MVFGGILCLRYTCWWHHESWYRWKWALDLWVYITCVVPILTTSRAVLAVLGIIVWRDRLSPLKLLFNRSIWLTHQKRNAATTSHCNGFLATAVSPGTSKPVQLPSQDIVFEREHLFFELKMISESSLKKFENFANKIFGPHHFTFTATLMHWSRFARESSIWPSGKVRDDDPPTSA